MAINKKGIKDVLMGMGYSPEQIDSYANSKENTPDRPPQMIPPRLPKPTPTFTNNQNEKPGYSEDVVANPAGEPKGLYSKSILEKKRKLNEEKVPGSMKRGNNY